MEQTAGTDLEEYQPDDRYGERAAPTTLGPTTDQQDELNRNNTASWPTDRTRHRPPDDRQARQHRRATRHRGNTLETGRRTAAVARGGGWWMIRLPGR